MSICEQIYRLICAKLPDLLSMRAERQQKADGSYVTPADLEIQGLVSDYLQRNKLDFVLVSEEMDLGGFSADPQKDYLVLDPLDGTENFTSGLKEWGVGVSIYRRGTHDESMIALPELNELLISGSQIVRHSSRIYGLSSSLRREDLLDIEPGYEYRIMGCSMYNLFNVIRGSYAVFENVKGVNTWDILPGINLALEHGCRVAVDGEPYHGQFLPPVKKYRIKVQHQ